MAELGIVSAALFGAFAFGAGDMLGACASRRLALPNVVALSQVAAVAFLLAFTHAPDSAGLGARDTLTALAGGLSHAAALLVLYRGLSRGQVGVVAPLCAIFSVVLPLVGDIALGRPVGQTQFLGIGLCVTACVLITGAVERQPGAPPIWWSARLGIVSGFAYGAADMLLASIPAGETGAVVLVSRGASVAFALGLAILLARGPAGSSFQSGTSATTVAAVGPVSGQAGWISALCGIGVLLAMAAGVFDVMGQVAYVHAAARGSMGVASAVTALFPAVTVLLAVIFFRERVTVVQLIGYSIAGAGVLVLAG